MKKNSSAFSLIFTLVMLACVVFLVCYLPAVENLRYQLEDNAKSLETSQGRERKQQYEYDETVAALPEVQAELDRVLPLMETAQQEVTELKAERKTLREEKKALESAYDPANPQEVVNHE